LTSRQAECIGLIVTELVMNALKHAFPLDQSDAQITVAYDATGPDWKLSVCDNGVGKPEKPFVHEGLQFRPRAGENFKNGSRS
jgi:two-component sensor histidine kinase